MKFVFICIFLTLSWSANAQLFEFMQKGENKIEEQKKEVSLFENLNENKESMTKNNQNSNTQENSVILDEESQKIEKHQQEFSEIEKKESERQKAQRKELQDLEKKFKDINSKTKIIASIIEKDKSIKEELKKKFLTNSSNMKKYSQKINNIEKSISEMSKELNYLNKQLDKHLNNNYFKNEISRTSTKHADIENHLTVSGELTSNLLVSNELKLQKTKLAENYIEVDEDFEFVFENKSYSIKEIMHYNNLISQLKENCGEDLSCFITKKEENERKEKENLIENTIKSIRGHLESLQK